MNSQLGRLALLSFHSIPFDVLDMTLSIQDTRWTNETHINMQRVNLICILIINLSDNVLCNG